MNKWDEIFQKGAKYKPLNKVFLDRMLNKIKEIAVGNQQKTMVDIGCGTGDALLAFSQKGFNVTGIDVSEVAVKEAKKLLEKEGLVNPKLLVLDVNEISSTKEKFDIIFSKLVYAFVENKEKFIEDIKNLMSENSVFILMTPVLYENVDYTSEDKPKIATSFEETKKLLENNFNSVEIFHHDYFGQNGDTVTFLIMK